MVSPTGFGSQGKSDGPRKKYCGFRERLTSINFLSPHQRHVTGNITVLVVLVFVLLADLIIRWNVVDATPNRTHFIAIY